MSVPAEPHVPAPHTPFNISVEGLIGAGKSTFLGWLTEYASKNAKYTGRIQVSYEKIEEWSNLGGHNIFGSFCKDPREYAFSFQVLAMISRLKDSDQAHQCSIPCETCTCIRFTERSPFSDYCFASVNHARQNMDDARFEIYKAAMNYFLTHNQNLPSCIIYLRPKKDGSAICQRRIEERDRAEERNGVIPLDYLDQLAHAHDDVLGTSSNTRCLRTGSSGSVEGSAECLTPILVIDVSTNLVKDVTARESVMRQTFAFIEKHRGSSGACA